MEEIPNDHFNSNDEEIRKIKTKIKKDKGFHAFHLNSQLIQAIKKMGYKFPTPIQRKTIPEILSGFNVIAHSRTGSGKTAAFLLPALERLKEHSRIVGTRCLILSPTRELAHQTLIFCKKLGKLTNLRYALLVGGNELEGQFEKLAQNPDIIIATPGRVVHHLSEGSLFLKKIQVLIIDEADKMLELNFEDQLKQIIKECPANKQVLMFAATIQGQLANFMKAGIIKEYKLINIKEENQISEKLKVNLIYTRSEDKQFTLVSLFRNNGNSIININKELSIVFVMTKYHCEFLHEFLKYWNIPSLYIYGQMDQELRGDNLLAFRKGKVRLLIVTDVAARGLDIPMLDNVINYDFPDSQKLFIHRVGRTARAGREGKVISLVTMNDLPYFYDIKTCLGKVFSMTSSADILQLPDPNVVSFGAVPQTVINEVKETKLEYLNTKAEIDELYSTLKKAETKGITFRQKPSRYGIKQGKKLLSEIDIHYHPFYMAKNSDEIENQAFLNRIKHFKPKENYFERVNETSVKEEVIKEFKIKAEEYKRKKEIEKKREKIQARKAEDENENEDEGKDNRNNEIVYDSTKFLGKKQKRSKISNFKNNPQYISEIRDNNPTNNLWGGEKSLELDELTLNIANDDSLLFRKKTIWDKKKKNFVTAKIDKEGKRMNESGKIVKKNDKNPHPYQSWKKKNKMRIQRIGEIEKASIVENAKEKFTERKLQHKEGNNITGRGIRNEMKNFDQLLKLKKERFKKEQKRNKKFSKRSAKEKFISEKSHLNRRSQALIIKKIK